MTKKKMCAGSVLPKEQNKTSPQNRMLAYKSWAEAFSYPKQPDLQVEYDQLFRAKEVWLEGAEYLAENEFQRVRILSDIMGFYKAFGVEPDGLRPDALNAELEFMHYLIFKEINAPDEEKRLIVRDAQRKFFNEHLFPAARKISEKIIALGQAEFYLKNAHEMMEFLEAEAIRIPPRRDK